GARRPEQAAAAGRAAAHLGGAQEDRRLHHPFRGRSGVSRRPHHGDDRAAGKGEDLRRGAAPASSEHHGAAEVAGIRRADRAYLGEPARGSPPRAGAGGGEAMSVQTISTAPGTQSTMSARTRDRLLNVISPLALLIVWEICARFGFIDTRFFPAPSSVMATLMEMLRTGELVTHTPSAIHRPPSAPVFAGVPAPCPATPLGLNRPIPA